MCPLAGRSSIGGTADALSAYPAASRRQSDADGPPEITLQGMGPFVAQVEARRRGSENRWAYSIRTGWKPALRELPRLAVGPREPVVRLLVADEPLLGRIPLELAAQANGDVSQVAHGCRAVADFHVADR